MGNHVFLPLGHHVPSAQALGTSVVCSSASHQCRNPPPGSHPVFHPQGPRHQRPSTCAALSDGRSILLSSFHREKVAVASCRALRLAFSALARMTRVPLSRNGSCEFPQRESGSAVARSTLERTKVSPEDPLSHATFSPHEIGNGGCDDRSSIPSMILPGRFRRHPLPVAEYEMPASSVYFPPPIRAETPTSVGIAQTLPKVAQGAMRSVCPW